MSEGSEGFRLAVKVKNMVRDGITADRETAGESVDFRVSAPNENFIFRISSGGDKPGELVAGWIFVSEEGQVLIL